MNRLVPPVGPGDHVFGGPSAPVVLLEYGDYECPYCGRAHQVVNSLLRRFQGSVRFAFRHFPLAELHPHAVAASLAAESAGAQGKFWPMHDTLFENQNALEYQDLLRYAAALRLDVTRFANDVARETYLNKVTNDFRSGIRSGVSGTPTFFIDGVRYEGSWDPESLGATLREVIGLKKQPVQHP